MTLDRESSPLRQQMATLQHVVQARVALASYSIVARECGIARGTLTTWLADRATITVRTLLAIEDWALRQPALVVATYPGVTHPGGSEAGPPRGDGRHATRVARGHD